jgi:regulator of RNase E activity RraA
MPASEATRSEQERFAAIKADLALVSTASATQLLIRQGWRNATMVGLRPLVSMPRGERIVGLARTCRYLMRREPEGLGDPEKRRRSPEIVLIESIAPGEIFSVDARGVPTAGIIGDNRTARQQARGAAAAIINGAVRDAPYIAELGLPVFSATTHPSHSGRDLVPVDFDCPINMAGATVFPGDVILADDEAALAMPLELAEMIAAEGPAKELLEVWIREKISAGGSVHDYYPPSADKLDEYRRETGREPHI